MDGGEPDIPIYKVVECTGPTNTRVYKVAVYFRGKRLADSTGHSIQQAEMEAAKKALENSSELFPQLDYQKRVMAHSMKRQKGGQDDDDKKRHGNESHKRSRKGNDESNLPKQYRTRKESENNKSNDSSHSESDSDSPTELDASDSDDSHSHKCSKKVMNSHKKCQDATSDAECPSENEEQSSESNRNIAITSNNDTENPKDAAKEDISDDCDTDVSLESGEIL